MTLLTNCATELSRRTFTEIGLRYTDSSMRISVTSQTGRRSSEFLAVSHPQDDSNKFRDTFEKYPVVCGPNNTMYRLEKCLWVSPFPLEGYVELSCIYPDLEDFFTKRLRVKRASPTMLIEEVKKMAKEDPPNFDDIRTRLLSIGRLVLRNGVNEPIVKALTGLATVKFLPQSISGDTKVLVGKQEEFFINDHQRYSRAFADRFVLLDFSIEEVHVLDTILRHIGLGKRYLTHAVKEISTVGSDAVLSEELTQDFRIRAYALYW